MRDNILSNKLVIELAKCQYQPLRMGPGDDFICHLYFDKTGFLELMYLFFHLNTYLFFFVFTCQQLLLSI